MPYVEGISDWSEQEKFYSKKREEAFGKESVECANHFAVMARRQTMCHMLTRIKLFEKILDVKGSIVECGVYRGQGLMTFYHLSSILEPFAFNRKIYGFDTFEGFASIDQKYDPTVLPENALIDTDCEYLRKMIKLSDLNRPLGHISKAELIKGDAVKTIPQFVKEHPELIVAMLYLDFDLYQPTKVALEHFLPMIPKGGLVVFDELNVAKWAGETIAFKELLKVNEIELKKFPFEPYVSYFVV